MKTITLKKTLTFMIVITTALSQIGCSSTEQFKPAAGNNFNGSRQSIARYVTPELLLIMESLGLQVNEGNTPPTINGEFLASELLLYASNVPNDVLNIAFADTYFTLQNQNNLYLTTSVSYTTKNGTETALGTATVISGSGNKFTVFAKQNITNDEGSADGILVISGALLPNGIADFQFSLFMQDNHGVADFIANQQGRLFYDSDNLATRQ